MQSPEQFFSEDIHQTAASSLFVTLNWTLFGRISRQFRELLQPPFYPQNKFEALILHNTFNHGKVIVCKGQLCNQDSGTGRALCMGGINPINYYSHLNGSVTSKLFFLNLIPNAFFFR